MDRQAQEAIERESLHFNMYSILVLITDPTIVELVGTNQPEVQCRDGPTRQVPPESESGWTTVGKIAKLVRLMQDLQVSKFNSGSV